MSKWRVGRKVGRTLYSMVGDEPSDEDVLIGLLDSRLIAESIVADHNDRLDVRAGDHDLRWPCAKVSLLRMADEAAPVCRHCRHPSSYRYGGCYPGLPCPDCVASRRNSA